MHYQEKNPYIKKPKRLQRSCFPDQFKLSEVTSVFRKEDGLSKEFYHAVYVLSHASKFFERLVFNQRSAPPTTPPPPNPVRK